MAMIDWTSLISTTVNLALFLVGFGLIVFVHELGHYLAARWAGIRVLAFAMGFGPAVCSYRAGRGWVLGSRPNAVAAPRPGDAAPERGETEYRLNWLPFGGYVKMLGQEDLDPGAVSDAPDSFLTAKPWKRLVVISAGVVMNIILAAVLFVAVFMVGLRTEPPVVGAVGVGTPASRAVALNADAAGVAEPGLQPGDEVIRVEGRAANSFNDVVLAANMAARGQAVSLVVRRPGVTTPLDFRVTPEPGRLSGLLEMGIGPARSTTIASGRSKKENSLIREGLALVGLAGVEPGMRLVAIDGADEPTGWWDLERAASGSGGRALPLRFEGEGGTSVVVSVRPTPTLQTDLVRRASGRPTPIEHLLGLTAVMMVASCEPNDEAYAKGLRTGDVFLRIGSVEYPNLQQGMDEIQANSGRSVPVVVLRRGAEGREAEVTLSPRVSREGRIGFAPGDTGSERSMVSGPSREFLRWKGSGLEAWGAPGRDLALAPGTTIAFVDGRAVSSFAEIRAALVEATRGAMEAGGPARVMVGVRVPRAGMPEGEARASVREWAIPASEVRSLHALRWGLPRASEAFEPVQVLRKASGPVEAIRFGLHETQRVMLTTYVTFVRLVSDRTVKVEHLRGPVGITHMGTLIADRGLVWLLFFLALISVNLAVINFLPLPIVDGGQFVLILIEAVRGRPAPVALQNGLTLAGLVLIGSIFLVVTYNDVKNLFGL